MVGTGGPCGRPPGGAARLAAFAAALAFAGCAGTAGVPAAPEPLPASRWASRSRSRSLGSTSFARQKQSQVIAVMCSRGKLCPRLVINSSVIVVMVLPVMAMRTCLRNLRRNVFTRVV
jgi:hypothetical protein